MMKLYLASGYSRKNELKQYAEELRLAGIEVTSRWLEETHAPSTTLDQVSEQFKIETAGVDIQDIVAAETLVLFSEPADKPIYRGGSHFESGFHYGLYFANQVIAELLQVPNRRTSIVVVGPKQNIFHWLTDVRVFETWEKAKKYLVEEHERQTGKHTVRVVEPSSKSKRSGSRRVRSGRKAA